MSDPDRTLTDAVPKLLARGLVSLRAHNLALLATLGPGEDYHPPTRWQRACGWVRHWLKVWKWRLRHTDDERYYRDD